MEATMQATSGRIGLAVLPLLAWLLASFATAAAAHTLISLGSGSGGYAHGAVAPVALAALGLITSLLLAAALREVSRSTALNPVMVLAHRFAKMRPLLPIVAVAVGGIGTLLTMEFTEQLTAFGRIEGTREAFGGNEFTGLAIVVVVAALLTVVGLRSARALVFTAVAAVGALVRWIIVKRSSLIDRGAIRRRPQRRRHASSSAFLARCFGLRAPPSTIL